MYTGSCLCGCVELTIKGGANGGIQDIIHCHCSLCRKNSGTAYATNGFVNTDAFVITKGRESLSTFSFKPGRYRHFCQHCGSPIYSSNDDDPSRIRIRLGILDSDIQERPISHNFMTSKANWDDLDAELPRNDEFERGRVKSK
ncbi:GFA family protein [Marinomonas agarivorans]|nr:GFA family protein [Marinomonas agarivorans]